MDLRFGMAMLAPRQIARLARARWLGRRLGLVGYQVNHLHVADAMLSLEGKRVLEVGGSMPRRMVVDHYECASWSCVDNRAEYIAQSGFDADERVVDDPADGRWTLVDGRVEELAASQAGPFDVIYSSAVLEHVVDLRGALREMQRVLVPEGVMFHAIGPIWSGPRGFHVYPSYFKGHGPDAGARVLAALGPWMHLLKTSEQMLEHLEASVGRALAEVAVESIYDSPRLNRRFFHEYLAHFDEAGLEVQWLHPWNQRVKDERAWEALRERGFRIDEHRFDTFWTILRRRR